MRIPASAHQPTGHRPKGRWSPPELPRIQQWVAEKVDEANQRNDLSLDPSLIAFQQLVNSNPAWKALSNDMFTQSSKYYDPTGVPAIQSFDEFLNVVNLLIKSSPPFYVKETPKTAMEMIGLPINTVLNWPMGTMAGHEFWLTPAINASFKEILNTWGSFLDSPASQASLKAWLSQESVAMIEDAANCGKEGPAFEEIFVCDPTAPYYGYPSWDDFFTRKFRDGIRPVECPDDAPPTLDCPDPTLVIANACESAPFKLATNVKMQDTFWLKSQPYSLDRMMNNNPLATQFVDGTVYQAFLSSKSYHRWHAPVSGSVVDIEKVPGTYFSENYFEGLAGNWRAADPAAPNNSQPYLSAVATRAIIWIQAKNPTIGLMAIVLIGMAEVSGCEFTVSVGDTIAKGQDIGMFHFGGSTHCLVFRKGVKLDFYNKPPWNMATEYNNRVNSALAIASACE
jgi:phosphatidylserine decarboxylase